MRKDYDDKLKTMAAERLECPPEDIVLEHAEHAHCGLERFYRALAHNKINPNTMVYVRFELT